MVSSKKELIDRIRKAKNRLVSSDILRVYNSDLYDFQVVRRAVLLAIVFLQCKDEDAKKPEGTKFHSYTGWCWASQKFLAFRAGTTEDYVHQCIKVFKKDGVVEERMWWDEAGYPHAEYHVIDSVIDAHQRPEGFMQQDRRKHPRRGGNKKANKSSFKPGNQAAADRVDSRTQPSPLPHADRVGSRLPSESTAVSQPSLQPLPDGCELGEGGLSLGGYVLEGSSSSTTATGRSLASSAAGAAGLASGQSSAQAEEKSKNQKQSESESEMWEESLLGQRREDFAGRHTEETKRVRKPELAGKHTPQAPPPNRVCYAELYEKWKAAGGGKLPHCKRCDARLDWEEHHVCPGYVPKYPEFDKELRQQQREKARELIHEGYYESRSVECRDCGEELHGIEDAMSHDCPAKDIDSDSSEEDQ